MGHYLSKLSAVPCDQQWSTLYQWIQKDPQVLYHELRHECPVLQLPGVTVVSRFSDCTTVLRQHDIFTVALYKPKQGEYWMAQDDTARHWREKSVMRSILDFEQLPDIRGFVASQAAKVLQEADGSVDVVSGLSRAIPVRLVQDFFGFDGITEEELLNWSFWSQYDAFHNQPFNASDVKDPALVSANRIKGSEEMATYLGALLQRRIADLKAGEQLDDPASRLIKLSLTGALDFDLTRVAQNVGGLLIGTVETTSNTVVNAISELLNRKDIHQQLHQLAQQEDTAEFDHYVFEALRFNPAFPYLFRMCEQQTVLAEGTEFATQVEPGTIVIALVGSAMFDETIFARHDEFLPGRSETNTFHFGYGMHECLGIHIGRVMIPEIVRQIFLLNDVQVDGCIDYKDGPFPEQFDIRWKTESASGYQCRGVEYA
ncbi:cytochrome P450 [Oceanospirillum sediminis]|uniref:Cytochrome P450 n=1 Tax=Oceanospirillum sediminis TaxID=2760088 RepID=A0A839IM64_9GAMM|nr:cytochrome P450 [Oceanospirillum sediminis]MBB1486048.1 cytochrome P450 [Oceanospirillum sediminis]